jgi:hypothetical protein
MRIYSVFCPDDRQMTILLFHKNHSLCWPNALFPAWISRRNHRQGCKFRKLPSSRRPGGTGCRIQPTGADELVFMTLQLRTKVAKPLWNWLKG